MTATNTTTASTTTTDDTPAGFWRDTQGRLVPEDKVRDIDKLLMEETGLPVVIADDPLTCVARGGGRILELMDEMGPGHFGLE